MKKRYAIGIDPGVDAGYAIYDRERRQIVKIKTLDFWAVMEWVTTGGFSAQDAFIVIETPKKTRLYERQDKEQGERRREKIAANAGGNAREAELLADGLERLGFEVRRVTPQRSKLDAKEFARVTGIKEKTNQHVRDAVMLVWQM